MEHGFVVLVIVADQSIHGKGGIVILDQKERVRQEPGLALNGVESIRHFAGRLANGLLGIDLLGLAPETLENVLDSLFSMATRRRERFLGWNALRGILVPLRHSV